MPSSLDRDPAAWRCQSAATPPALHATGGAFSLPRGGGHRVGRGGNGYEAYAASGLSGPKFAALHGVNYQTFAAWLQKRKRAVVPPGLPAPQDWALIEVAVPAVCESAAGLAVLLPGGAELRVAGSEASPLAVALLRELSRPC